MEGIIVQNISGLYLVYTETGYFRCRARGVFRKNNITLSTGDKVSFEVLTQDEGIINELLPRKNEFIRPNVANIDMICYVVSSKYPQPDTFLIDKMIVLSELKGVEITLILNKLDLDDGTAAKVLDIYEELGFKVVRCTATEMTKSKEILDLTRGKTVVLTGNTGVGKSSIINALEIGVQTKVDEISLKLGRGRHTTREVTFYLRQDGGFFGDSPGFGNVDITLEDELTPENLATYFKEFKSWRTQCGFSDCSHTGEANCLIADKVSSGEIAETRYQSYIKMYRLLQERENRKNYKKRV